MGDGEERSEYAPRLDGMRARAGVIKRCRALV